MRFFLHTSLLCAGVVATAILAVLTPLGVLGILTGSLAVLAPQAAAIIARILLVTMVGFAHGVRLGLRPRSL